ncbi:nitrile hydratase [Pseudonocardia sp. EC080610-09]|uniref:nitrile hydratase subunit beta n=1 Tax=unclassified Pseudonocardia TaxID=2619320 RepID=UPI0006CB4E8B|nr:MULTISPECIES: nitrile hydratase subunit beta [unclassified Pseudonocardia]ALE73577.1 nitrile hydratase [Pseudonocardia sp. EC080625-04]ALL76890.1 nitrile hydratase [Pseudonocardia sp. EC080610-09]ALL83921.1 nitrile hydratase [Pseudonocardia sp. EC080619-01]
MDGVHDLGGRQGFGPIDPEADEPVFHSDWERRVLVMFPAMAGAGAFNLDQFRYGMEQIPPAEYLASTYYEHWMHSMIHWGIEAGIFDPEDLERRTRHYLEHPEEAAPKAAKADLTEALRQLIPTGADYRRETDSGPAFGVGDRVRVLDHVSTMHTRRAGYVRGRTGEIVATHGAYVYPDSNAAGLGEDPHHLYTVRFRSEELWGAGEPGAANAVNHIDLWEPYLTAV